MNITRENIDELNAVLKIQIEKTDYEGRVDEVLKDYRKKAQIPGFRPGKVPAGLVKKMYGTAVLVEEVNKLISDSLQNYFEQEKLEILGEPLPSENENTDIDWKNQESFEFSFDLGLSPELDIKLSKRDKFTFYQIEVDKESRDNYINNYARRFGEFQNVNEVEDDEMLTGTFNQADEDGNVLENGISKENASIALNMLKDEGIKGMFKGAKLNDIVTFDLKKAYPNETEIATLLGIEKEAVAEMQPTFQFTITEIKKFVPHELNQDLFDQVYGENSVASLEEFEQKVEEEIKASYDKDSDYRFSVDAKKKLIKKFNPDLPNEFLKRWLFEVNKEKFTKEDIDKDYDKFVEDLQWQLIKNKIIKEQEIKVEAADVKESAKELARYQFQQYGLFNLGEDHIDNYANEILKKQDDANRLFEKVAEDKVMAFVKEAVKLDEKSISLDDFNKLFEKD